MRRAASAAWSTACFRWHRLRRPSARAAWIRRGRDRRDKSRSLPQRHAGTKQIGKGLRVREARTKRYRLGFVELGFLGHTLRLTTQLLVPPRNDWVSMEVRPGSVQAN